MSCPVKRRMYEQEIVTCGYIHESEQELESNMVLSLMMIIVQYFTDPFDIFLFVENDQIEYIKFSRDSLSTTDALIPFYYNVVQYGPAFKWDTFQKLRWKTAISYDIQNGSMPKFGVGIALDKYTISGGNSCIHDVRPYSVYWEICGYQNYTIKRSWDKQKVRTVKTLHNVDNFETLGILIEKHGSNFDVAFTIDGKIIDTFTNNKAEYIQFISGVGPGTRSITSLPIEFKKQITKIETKNGSKSRLTNISS